MTSLKMLFMWIVVGKMKEIDFCFAVTRIYLFEMYLNRKIILNCSVKLGDIKLFVL